MRVYSTTKFLSLLSASIIVALALTYMITFIPRPSQSNPGYTLSTIPTSLQVTPGGAGSYALKLTSQNGFSGSLKLGARVPNAPNSLAVSLSPTDISLSADGSATTTLNVATNPVTPAGTYSIAIDETSSTASRTDTVNLNVVGFIVTADPSSLSLTPTSVVKANITVTAMNGFSGRVNLLASSTVQGPTVDISPNTLFLAQNATAASTLTVQSQAQGRFDITVTVIGDQFYQSVSLPVTVGGTTINGDFSITTIPGSFDINPGSFRNVIVRLDSIGDCGCLVTLSVTTPARFDYGIGPYIVQVPPEGSVNSTLTISAYAGGVNVTPGIYIIAVTGTSLSKIHSTQLTATVTTTPVADISLEADPLFVSVMQGSSSTSLITIRSVNGFSGTISLAASTTPPDTINVGLSLNPTSVQLTPDGTATSTLTVTATTSASLLGYNFTVTGTTGTLTRGVYGNIIILPRSGPLQAAPLETQVPAATSSTPIMNAFIISIGVVLASIARPALAQLAVRTRLSNPDRRILRA